MVVKELLSYEKLTWGYRICYMGCIVGSLSKWSRGYFLNMHGIYWQRGVIANTERGSAGRSFPTLRGARRVAEVLAEEFGLTT